MSTTTNVNLYLSAKTPGKLIELQLLNNAVNSMHFNYQTPLYANGMWFCWFFADIEEWISPDTIEGDALKIAKGEL